MRFARLPLAAVLIVGILFASEHWLHATAGDPSPDPFKLTVINGKGSGEYRYGGVVNIEAESPADGDYTFAGWALAAGDGKIGATISQKTTYTMGYSDARVVAVFARIKMWFPPGPEDSPTGLLLPKEKNPKPARLEHHLRLIVQRGSDQDVSDLLVKEMLNVKFGWKKPELLDFYDKKDGGNKIENEKNLKNDLFEKKGGDFEAKLWYEGMWKQEDYPTPPDATATATVIPTNTPPGTPILAEFQPVKVKISDRDDLTKKWTDAKDGSDKKLYAGKTTGDMVSWKLGGTDNWTDVTFIWTAEGPGGEIITGPIGAGKNEWKIADGDEDTDNDWIKWKPGKWKIKVQIGSTTAEFEQQVGWRTEDYVVIGQIVKTTTFQNSGPATLIDSRLFRDAIITDLFPFAPYSLAASALPDSVFGFIEFGYWGTIRHHDSTPPGPLWYAGAITEGDRYWMLENALNSSVDTPTVASPMTAAQMASAQSAGKYRIFHHYQTRFTLTSSGKIDTTSFQDIHNDGITGQTKFNIPAGALNPVWDNPDLPLFSLPAQTNPINDALNQGHTQTSSDGMKHSSYASGRVGDDGQNVNYHVMGQDLPWIYSEIICSVAPDHKVTSSIKMSVNKTWQDSGGVSGDTNFNNLNIYKATTSTDVSGAVSLSYVLQHSPFRMEGQLQSFILSVAPDTWPTPPTTPSVQ